MSRSHRLTNFCSVIFHDLWQCPLELMRDEQPYTVTLIAILDQDLTFLSFSPNVTAFIHSECYTSI